MVTTNPIENENDHGYLTYGSSTVNSPSEHDLRDLSDFFPSTTTVTGTSSTIGLPAIENNGAEVQIQQNYYHENSRLYEQPSSTLLIPSNPNNYPRTGIIEPPFYLGLLSEYGEKAIKEVHRSTLDTAPQAKSTEQIKDVNQSIREDPTIGVPNIQVTKRPQFLRPSELAYLPVNGITPASARGSEISTEIPRLTSLFTSQRVPALNAPIGSNPESLSRNCGPNYVGSSFLRADDVMVVEPVLNRPSNNSMKNEGAWPAVALALPTGTGAIPMKAKRGRARAGRFACPECNVVFRQTGNLRKHVAEIHQKSKPFRCGVCGNYFSRKHARDTHLKAVHHKLRPFECSLCFKRYKNRRYVLTLYYV